MNMILLKLMNLILYDFIQDFNVSDNEWSPRIVNSFATDLACALCEFHRLGIVHNDVKSANVLVDAGHDGGRKVSKNSSLWSIK